MIDPQAGGLGVYANDNPIGAGYPVGWAVRGFLPEELARRNERKPAGQPVTNSYNMLPVFRGDFLNITTRSPNPIAETPEKHWLLRRFYWISTDPSSQMIRPKTLKEQITEASRPNEPVRPDDTADIAQGRWDANSAGPAPTAPNTTAATTTTPAADTSTS
jgi:hypothetical protein